MKKVVLRYALYGVYNMIKYNNLLIWERNEMEKGLKRLSRREFVKLCILFGLAGLGIVYSPFLRKYRKLDIFGDTELEFEPSYLKLHRSGELRKRGESLWEIMRSCTVCPRRCGVNRLAGTEGFCHASSQLEVSSFHPHFGEEKPLVGRNGSGTVFFTNCGLRCVFCINWNISLLGKGNPCSIDELADMMLKLQNKGCHNINLVTPTHYVPHIVLAVDKAAAKGLRLPLVYNTCGWESLETLKVLDGIIDIYLPDFKYSAPKMAKKYSSGAFDYPEVTKKAFLEMYRQVGTAVPGKNGLLYRGLMVRHLVMPGNTSGAKGVLEWIANNLPKDTYLNLMSQYQPFYKAFDYPEIARRITVKEYQNAIQWAKEAGLTNVHLQGTIGLGKG